MLRRQPRNAAAWNLLGVMAAQAGEFTCARGNFERAIEIDATKADYHFNLGNALLELRQREAALACYDRAVALDPAHVGVHTNRGSALRQLGNDALALQSFQRAAALAPGVASCYCNIGLVLADLGRLEEAIANFEQAIAREPSHADAHYNHGNAEAALGRFAEAIASYDRALGIRPRWPAALNNRGSALRELGRPLDALCSFDAALTLDADHGGAHGNRALALSDLGRWEEAAAAADRAVALQPGDANAYSNRGVIHQQRGSLQQALKDFDRAVALRPDLSAAQQNRAQLLLLMGDYEQGWKAYEWRRRNTRSAVGGRRRQLAAPLWLGAEPLSGKTVVLHAEQGLGDSLQFCRYVACVVALGARVILEVPAELRTLMESLADLSQILTVGEPLPPHDYQCSLLSLPFAFGTTAATIPANVPYLRASSDEVSRWRSLLGPRCRPRVGLVWSGGFRAEQPHLWPINARRNIPLRYLTAFEGIPVDFYSLQKGAAAEQELSNLQTNHWCGPKIFDYTQQLADFAATAALVENLDLVISVDTSTAHLAGALGKPVWILNRFDCCWRWLVDRDDSPWYPTARLYRQRAPGDWEDVVGRVAVDLRNWAQSTSM
jgi:tetratricopeptide (TPR) repeat protein